jgi:hypothetical protein
MMSQECCWIEKDQEFLPVFGEETSWKKAKRKK